jgi:hypothetical protein
MHFAEVLRAGASRPALDRNDSEPTGAIVPIAANEGGATSSIEGCICVSLATAVGGGQGRPGVCRLQRVDKVYILDKGTNTGYSQISDGN